MSLRGAPDPAARKEAEFDLSERMERAMERAIAAQVALLKQLTVAELLAMFDSVHVRLGDAAHIQHPAERERGINLDLAAVIEALAEQCVACERAAYLSSDEYDDDRR